MVTLLVFSVFLIFQMFYATSKRAELHFEHPLQKWFHENRNRTHQLGSGLLLVSLLLYIYVWNISGVFAWLLVLMCVGTLIVLLMPLRLLSFKGMILLFLIFFLIELFI